MKLFEKIRMRRLGVSEERVQGILEEMEKVHPIDDTKDEVLAMRVMSRLRSENPNEWCKAKEVGFDFEGLLDFITELIEMLMPFIVKARPPIPVYTRTPN